MLPQRKCFCKLGNATLTKDYNNGFVLPKLLSEVHMIICCIRNKYKSEYFIQHYDLHIQITILVLYFIFRNFFEEDNALTINSNV